jgi:hypothetical protein
MRSGQGKVVEFVTIYNLTGTADAGMYAQAVRSERLDTAS